MPRSIMRSDSRSEELCSTASGASSPSALAEQPPFGELGPADCDAAAAGGSKAFPATRSVDAPSMGSKHPGETILSPTRRSTWRSRAAASVIPSSLLPAVAARLFAAAAADPATSEESPLPGAALAAAPSATVDFASGPAAAFVLAAFGSAKSGVSVSSSSSRESAAIRSSVCVTAPATRSWISQEVTWQPASWTGGAPVAASVFFRSWL
mmetsp:Transcript_15926/g.50779  ORF Transcript_15926/g.50779 Transcript_15926/m.50779 type:complete len:210 (+) Transcript_15926:1546-2175(+)